MSIVLRTIAFFACAFALSAHAAYPTKPVRLIVPYVAGGSFDTVARQIAQPLGEKLGQQVVVDNRAGATGIIGTETVARAQPDGYTIGLFGGNQVLSAAVRPKLPYDMLNDFQPIGRFATIDNVVAVHPSLPAKSLKELIALLKASPGKYQYGSGGYAGDTHFTGALFALAAGVELLHVPYKGGGLAVTGLVSNEVQLMVVNLISAEPHIRSGRLRGLAIAAKQRSPLLPDVPTASEAGLPGFEWAQWYSLFAPVRTPRPIVARLRTELERIVASPDFNKKLTSQGAQPVTETPEQTRAFVKEMLEVSRKIAKSANIRAE